MKKTYHITVHVEEDTLPIPGAGPCTEKPRRFEKGMVVLTKDNYVCEVVSVHPHPYTHEQLLEAKILFSPQKRIQGFVILTAPTAVKEVLYRA